MGMQTIINKVVPAQQLPRNYLTQFLDATVSAQLGQVGILIAHEEKRRCNTLVLRMPR